MAAISSTWATPITTRGTTTSTTYASDLISIPSSFFVAGEKYLIYAHLLSDMSTASNVGFSTFFHGTTEMPEHQHSMEEPNTGTAKGHHHRHWCVWTAVSGEGFSLRIRVNTGTMGYDQVTMGAIRLTGEGLTQGTDWDFNEVATDVALSTTPLTGGASLTFTPGATGDYLVMTSGMLDEVSITASYGSRIFSSGTYNDTLPSCVREGEDSGNEETQNVSNMRVFTGLTAVSQTFREESFNTGSSSGTRVHSQVFWLRLAAFRNYTAAYTAADEVLGTTDWADPFQVGLAITPTVTGTVVYFGFCVADLDALGNEIFCRLQTDNTDTPATQTTDLKQEQETAAATDENQLHRQWSQAVTASTTYTFDFEGDLSGTAGTPHVQQRTAVVFTTELASVTPKSMTFPAQPHMLHLLVR